MNKKELDQLKTNLTVSTKSVYNYEFFDDK